MPLSVSATVLIAVVLGGVLGWWPLASWAIHHFREAEVSERLVRVVAAATTAIVWGVVVWRVGVVPVLPAALAFTAASTVLAIIDVAEQRLPDRVVLSSLAVVAVLLLAASAVSGAWIALLWAFLGGLAMFASYFAIALLSPRSMGMGDVKLAALIGLLLGWLGLTAWLVGLVAAFLVGGVVALVALALRRVTLKGSIPFGPAMLAGGLIGVLFVS
ncbi:prepilin peptidase [Agromyces protaetiae]|uniref:Prepilin peptidase n=1 Tax=Agromyces protaetiae TaxID=2509455 RepID=A0A4P6F916_9MICO|nr:prepilin peptidase [Agromyces protaetiae]QAY72264.1 prepilin peptidase [Agromyces protaetiae]